MSKVGNKSMEEVCNDCLYNSSSSNGGIKMHDTKVETETNFDYINQRYMIENMEDVFKPINLLANKHKHPMPVEFETILHEMANTYERKNSDYGNSFKDLFNEFGMTSSIIRLSDKLNRLKSLQKNKQLVSDESQIDTLLDMANYAIMTIVELKNK